MYVVCIPSYNRANECNQKTLKTLHTHNIGNIYVYVATEEYELYKTVLDPNYYTELRIGSEGLVQQRQCIMNQWNEGERIVFMDDDIENIDMSLSNHTLDAFIQQAFQECITHRSFIWGVYPVLNPFFRKTKREMTTDLKYIVGAFYGILNRPTLQELQLTLTETNGQKEDVERTIRYYIQDGIVLRFNKIGFKTKYYGKVGGLGSFKDRLKPMEDACVLLQQKYSNFGRIKIRKNGMYEFVLHPPKNPM
jgi:hypothetical protein